MRKLFLLLLAASGFAVNSNAQGTCATDVVYQNLKQQHPEIAVYEQQLEQSIRQGMEKVNLAKFARTTTMSSDTTTYDIPIVVHVVHDYGAEYLKDDDIFNAVQYWASIYVCQNADTADVIDPFKKYVGNARIRLHLATKDPNGNPTKGITHEQSYLTNSAGDQAKLDQWPPNEYINVWFINNFSSAMSGAAAYAYYPSSAAYMPYYDGVIGLYSYLNYDKAIPHEIGHVLNLKHPWGDTNSPGVACGDDEVDDTPPTKGHLPVGCVPSALYDVTCATGYSKTYSTGTPGVDSTVNYPDTVNAQNIMDYTYCQKMFTKGQVERMRLALTSNVAGRNNLYSASNLALTGALAPMPDLAPIADFSVDRAYGAFSTEPRSYFMCANNIPQFTFTNRSWNDTITDVQWTFSNGASIPTSNSLTSVNERFSMSGWVTVTLKATGNNTGSNTITNTHAVYVADTTSLQPSGYIQNFTGSGDFDKWPMFNYYDNQFKWELYNGAGYNDGSCLRYRSYDDRVAPANTTGTPVGDYDDIISPAFDLTGTSPDVNLNFYTSGSYKPGSGAPQDSLIIYVSTNCGTVWHSIAAITSTQLANNTAQASEFIPAAGNQWKAQTVSIPAAYKAQKVFFKFRYKPGSNGNDFYMDKLEITPYTTDVNEVVTNPTEIKIFPNPTHGDSKVVFTCGSDGKVMYNIHDITGKSIYQQQGIYTPNTLVQKDIYRSIFPGAGVYFVTVTISNKTITQKLVVE